VPGPLVGPPQVAGPSTSASQLGLNAAVPGMASGVGETRSLDLRLQAALDAPSRARRQVGALASGLPSMVREDLRLLVSELVANSLRHAGLQQCDWIDVRVSVGSERVRVEISDPGQGFESPLQRDPTQSSGSGLWLLNAIASRWGVIRDRTTRVWFETDLSELGNGDGTRWSLATSLQDWPPEAQEAAEQLERLYGPPDEADGDRMLWRRGTASELSLRRGA